MARKSAKRKRSKNSSSSRARNAYRSSVPAWVWLFSGSVLGAFVMFLVYLSGIPPQASAIAANFENDDFEGTENNNTGEGATQEDESIPKPRFDFYQLLKESEVVINNDSENTGDGNRINDNVKSTNPNNPPNNPNSNQTPHEYVLQVGSFQNSEDADRLRAELILLNLEVKTETVKVRNAEIWHRVLVGPFDTRNTMERARTTLASHDINSLLTQTR